MAIIVLLTPQIIVNSVDLTNHITQVTLEESFEAVDTTAFGVSAKQYAAGLGDNKLTIEFQQDFAAASVESTIYPLLGTLASFTVKPLMAATSTTNPAYSGLVLVDDWKPIDGKAGALMVSSATWPVSGLIAKAFS